MMNLAKIGNKANNQLAMVVEIPLAVVKANNVMMKTMAMVVNQTFLIYFNNFFLEKHEELAKLKAQKVAIMKPKWKSVWRKPITERVELSKSILKNFE